MKTTSNVFVSDNNIVFGQRLRGIAMVSRNHMMECLHGIALRKAAHVLSSCWPELEIPYSCVLRRGYGPLDHRKVIGHFNQAESQ